MLNIIEINNFNAPELDVYARYTEAQLLNKDRPEDGLFIAESPKVIGRALDAGYIPISVLVEKKQMEENEETQEVLARFENIGTSIFTAEFAVLTQLTGFKLTRGMLCALKRRPLEDFRKLCEGKNRIAILEDVMNPTNVGAIFRSAAAMHMDAVLLTSGCSNPLYRRASRVSMGTVFQVPWAYFPKYNVGSDNTFSDASLHDKCDSRDQNCNDRNSSVYKYNIDVFISLDLRHALWR